MNKTEAGEKMTDALTKLDTLAGLLDDSDGQLLGIGLLLVDISRELHTCHETLDPAWNKGR